MYRFHAKGNIVNSFASKVARQGMRLECAKAADTQNTDEIANSDRIGSGRLAIQMPAKLRRRRKGTLQLVPNITLLLAYTGTGSRWRAKWIRTPACPRVLKVMGVSDRIASVTATGRASCVSRQSDYWRSCFREASQEDGHH